MQLSHVAHVWLSVDPDAHGVWRPVTPIWVACANAQLLTMYDDRIINGFCRTAACPVATVVAARAAVGEFGALRVKGGL